jgi:hypothetical protein
LSNPTALSIFSLTSASGKIKPSNDAGYEQYQVYPDTEETILHYEQLKLLKQQVQQLITDDQILEGRIGLLEEEQKTTWFHLLTQQPDFLKLSDASRDILKK